MKPVRINKFLADAGVCSRRKAEPLVLEGRVKINGSPVTELGAKVDPRADRVTLDGKPLLPEKKVYFALNKPRGVICTARDEMGRMKVTDLVPEAGARLHYAGRLDADTSGLVILTSDGEVTSRITHPRLRVPKVYRAVLRDVPSRKDTERFARGLEIEDYVTAPAKIRVLEASGGVCEAEITLSEGRQRQARKMCAAIGCPVIRLKRVAVGEIKLGRLKEGTYRRLKKNELEYLKRL